MDERKKEILVGERVRQMRTLVDCVNYLFGGKWEGVKNRCCDYNHHRFELRREKDLGLFKEKGFVLDICDGEGGTTLSMVEFGRGWRVRYFMNIKKPRMVNALFQILSMPYNYRDKGRVLEDFSTRTIYNEGQLPRSKNQNRTFDCIVERFCEDITYIGGHIPLKLKREIMKLKAKLVVKIPVIDRESGEEVDYVEVKRETGEVFDGDYAELRDVVDDGIIG